jgi:DNA polymerase-3 subunit alpha
MEEWPPLEKLRLEFSAVGFYLTSHPLNAYGDSLEQAGITPVAEMLSHMEEGTELQTYRLAGIVITKQERAAKSGQRYAFVQLSDPTGVFEVTVFSELLSKYREVFQPGAALLVTVSAQYSEENLRLTCQGIEMLEKATDGGSLTITLGSEDHVRELIRLLDKAQPGKTKIVAIVPTNDNEMATLALPSSYAMTPDLRASLGQLG